MHFERFCGAFETLLCGDRGTTVWKLGLKSLLTRSILQR